MNEEDTNKRRYNRVSARLKDAPLEIGYYYGVKLDMFTKEELIKIMTDFNTSHDSELTMARSMYESLGYFKAKAGK